MFPHLDMSLAMHVLFDLDGTLIDSRPGIVRCLQSALSENGLPAPEEGELQWCVGPPIQETIRKLVGPDAQHLFESTLRCYRDHYSSKGIFECSLYPEIEETLAATRALGCTLHVATSKLEVYAQSIISHFGLDHHFSSVNGSCLDGTLGDKSVLIGHVLRSRGIDPITAVMIGDREHDMVGATQNGVHAIGALWGYGSGRELMESGATLCARIPRLLVDLIKSLR